MSSLRNVYILGAGGIGTLISSHLSRKFAIQYILRNQDKIDLLKRTQNQIQITQLFNGGKTLRYNISGACKSDKISDDKIDFLIVSVKTFDSLNSIRPLVSKIDKTTKILLIQNGMGVIEELYSKLWPEINSRPSIYQGIITHGVFQDKSNANTFKYNHAGLGNLKICKMPRSDPSDKNIVLENDGVVDDSVIEELNRSADLHSTYHKYYDLMVYQVEKLLINACINPVTATLNCANGELAEIESAKQLFKEVIDEGLDVMVEAFPVLLSSSLFEAVLNKDKLLDSVVYVGTVVNGKNSSSMRQDVLSLRDTEIDYINGYIAMLGKKLGKDAKVNKTMELMVKSRLHIDRDRA